MDPVTALGVTSAAVHFLQFSLQVLDTCRQIRDDAQSSTQQNRELEDAARTVKASRAELVASKGSKIPRRILDVANHCVQASDELLKLLEEVRGAGKQISALKATCRALKARRTIEKLERNLKERQEMLNQLLVQDMWSKSELLALQQSTKFAELSKGVQDLTQRLIDQTALNAQISNRMEDLKIDTEKRLTELDRNAKHRYEASMQSQRHTQFLQSLFFPEIDLRRNTIKEAAPNTLEWLYDVDSEQPGDSFAKWLFGSECSTYWISGKAGSGKSTLMAHLVEDSRTADGLKAWSQTRELCIISFYFWRPGSFLQKSAIGLLRSLLYQICQKRPSIITSLNHQLRLVDGCIPSWTEKALRTCIVYALQKLRDACFAIFIDGLDEYEGDYNSLLDLVLDLENSGNVKLCLASRPEVQFSKRLQSLYQLRLQDLNEKDIREYVEQRLNRTIDAANWNMRMTKSDLIHGIVHGSEGIFLWAAIVTSNIIKGLDAGDDEDILRERIASTPREMDELFQGIFERLDSFHLKSLSFYFQALEMLRGRVQVSLLTSSKYYSDDQDEEEFVEACRQTQTQILAQGGGLLEFYDLQPLQAQKQSWESAPYKHVSCGKVMTESFGGNEDSHVKHEHASLVKCEKALYLGDVPYPRMLEYESRFVTWSHRSVHDFIRGEKAQTLLQNAKLSDQNVIQKLWNGWLKYIQFAPSYVFLNDPHIPEDYTTSSIWRVALLLSRVDSESWKETYDSSVINLNRLRSCVDNMSEHEFSKICFYHSHGYSGSPQCCNRTRFLALCANSKLYFYLDQRLQDLACPHFGEAALLDAIRVDTGELSDVQLAVMRQVISELAESWEIPETERPLSLKQSLLFFQGPPREYLHPACGWTFSLIDPGFRHRRTRKLIPDASICALARALTKIMATWLDAPPGESSDALSDFIAYALPVVKIATETIQTYISYGLNNSRISLQFPLHQLRSAYHIHSKAPWKDKYEVLADVVKDADSVRIVCPIRRSVYRDGTNPSECLCYEKRHDFIVFQPSGSAASSIAQLMSDVISRWGLLNSDMGKSKFVEKIQECEKLLIDEIWINEQGLSAMDQLLVLASVRVGFRSGPYVDPVFDTWRL